MRNRIGGGDIFFENPKIVFPCRKPGSGPRNYHVKCPKLGAFSAPKWGFLGSKKGHFWGFEGQNLLDRPPPQVCRTATDTRSLKRPGLDTSGAHPGCGPVTLIISKGNPRYRPVGKKAIFGLF